MSVSVVESKSPEEIEACWPVIRVLRPHVVEGTLVDRIVNQQGQGYRLMCIKDPLNGHVASILGFRVQDYLYSGKTLYIDDFCTLPEAKGKGYGGQLLDWVIAHAKTIGCATVSLDSGFARNDAHRLYLNKRFQLGAHHFVQFLQH